MKVLVIGGTGHVGSFLVPMLLEQGHEVYVGTRGRRPAHTGTALDGAKFITFDVNDKESLRSLREYRFDAVAEFPGYAYAVWNELKDTIGHLVACGSLWMFGYPNVVPTPEQYQNPCLFGGYDTRIVEMWDMIAESGKGGTGLFTAIMPPNICGPGKIPLDGMGGRSAEVHRAHARGETVILPEGPEALIAPCDAEDIAALFALAINNPKAAGGQIFNVGAADAVTATELIRLFGEIYGVEIPIERVSWEKYTTEINPPMGNWWHFYAHMLPDISKARNLLGYEPQYTVKETLRRAVDWMRSEGVL